jgi:hypothetical protein
MYDTNIAKTLASKDVISFRYVVDTFSGQILPNSKYQLSRLAMIRQQSLALINAPSMAQFQASTDPRFTNAPTAANPYPSLNTAYIADGGNLSLNPSLIPLVDGDGSLEASGTFYIDKIRGNNRTFFSMNNSKHTTSNAITYTIDNMKYQFINPSRYDFGNVGEIIKQFDFICVMCGVDMKNKKLVYNNNFFSDANSKRIRINPTLKSPASLIDRIIKYTRKGFTLSKSSQRDALKLLSKVTEQEIDDVTLTMY